MTNQMVNIIVMSPNLCERWHLQFVYLFQRERPCFYLIPIRGEFITRTVSDNSCWRPLIGQNDNYIAKAIAYIKKMYEKCFPQH